MIGSVYKITNTLNGKSYIGQTTREPPTERIKYHFKISGKNLTLIQRAIKKYGKSNFVVEILACTKNQEDLNLLEISLIRQHNTVRPNGYNVKLGGEQGGKCTDSLKRKIGEKIKEYYANNTHPFKGKTFSEEHKKSLSIARKGFTSEARRIAHSKTVELLKLPVVAIHIQTGKEFSFSSIEECALRLNLVASCVSRVLRGSQNRTQHNGYKFYTLRRN